MDFDDRLLLLALDTLLSGGEIAPGLHPTAPSLVEAGLAMQMNGKTRLTPLGLQALGELRTKVEGELGEAASRTRATAT